MSCSVEKLDASQDHDVKRERFQEGFATLMASFSGPQGRSQESFEHANGGLHLPTLTVAGGVDAGGHHASPAT